MMTFSQAPRIEACPASEALPHTRSTASDSAAYGTALHAFLRDVNLLGVDEALEKSPEEYRDSLATVDLSRLPMLDPECFVPEVSFAFNPDSGVGVELARGSDERDYSDVPNGWWAGTADLVGISDSHVIVWDWKSGWAALPSPNEHLQMLGYAIAAAQTYGRGAAWVGFIRLPEGGEPRFDFRELEPWDLDEAGERFARIARAVGDARDSAAHGVDNLELTEGEHCRYCPAFSRCPAKAHLLGALVQATKGAEEQLDAGTLRLKPELTDENFPEVLRRYELARKLVDRIGETLEHFTALRYIPLGGGEVFGRVAVAREHIDLARGSGVLAAYGADVLEKAVQREESITKASLKEALRPWVAQRDKDKAKKDKLGITRAAANAEEALRKAGAMRIATHYRYARHKPKPLPAKDQPAITAVSPDGAKP